MLLKSYFLPCLLGFILYHNLLLAVPGLPRPHPLPLYPQPIQSSSFLSQLISICWFVLSLWAFLLLLSFSKFNMKMSRHLSERSAGSGGRYAECQICLSVREMGRAWKYCHINTFWFHHPWCYGFYLSKPHNKDQASDFFFCSQSQKNSGDLRCGNIQVDWEPLSPQSG